MSDKKKFAVIGHPISHSLSPQIHQAGYLAKNISAEYLALEIKSNELEKFVQNFRSGTFDGINVTLPHKESILTLLDELTDSAKIIGAVNTVKRNGNKLIGHNTDGLGYWQSLNQETHFQAEQKSAVILGSGGAARAILYALCQNGIKSVSIINRDEKRAQKLAQEFSQHFPKTTIIGLPWSTLSRWGTLAVDLLVNTTSLGLKNNPWEDLSFVNRLPTNCLVSDIVYNPRITELLTKARQASLKTHEGLGMLIHQAGLAWEFWLESPAPLDAMRKAVESI